MDQAACDTLADLCRADLLATKWLLAPSRRVGHQWIETVVRGGQAVVNLRPTTMIGLALEFVGGELAGDGLAFASRLIGPLVVDAAWQQLPPDGYFGRLERSPPLSAAAFESLLALRRADCKVARSRSHLAPRDEPFASQRRWHEAHLAERDGYFDRLHLENSAKAADLAVLAQAYEAFLAKHGLVDEADVLLRAARRLEREPVLGADVRVLIPAGMQFAGLERRLIEAIPAANRRVFRDEAARREPSGDATHDDPTPGGSRRTATSVHFFRAVGEVNEVREVLRRCLAEGQPLDDVELLHTDAKTYVPLIHSVARRYFSEPQRPEGVPVTFAEGIPASLSRPGRALSLWLRWIEEDFPQRLLVELLGEGLLQVDDDDESISNSLARSLRPLSIGFGAANYLPKLDERIEALRHPPTGDDEAAEAAAARDRARKTLRALRKLVEKLLALVYRPAAGAGSVERETTAGGAVIETLDRLTAAETFLSSHARSVSELDQYAAKALVEQLRDRRYWQQRLGVALDEEAWLADLPAQTCVMGSGPRPGHLHVANVSSGGHSGRRRTFVVGLDDRRFPGAALQDPILLDRERSRVSPELPTSAARLRSKLEEFDRVVRSGHVTLSWPCHDLADDRETFPSSVVLATFRRHSHATSLPATNDLETLNAAVGPPVSFAPDAADKSLDASERWLRQLTDDAHRGANQRPFVEAHFPHLARGSAAAAARDAGFGPFNGFVPQAGRRLNPFAEDGLVLSASGLETAGRCPLAFFFRSGLGLFVPEELEIDPDRWLNPMQFGLVVHEVFRRFLEELARDGRRPLFDRDHQRLAELLLETVQKWRTLVPPPNDAAFRAQYWQLVRTSQIFLQTEEEFCRTSQPRFFEVSLGLESEAATPLDCREPSRIALRDGRSIRVHGRIDRVDETTPLHFSIWDYKTGSGYGYDEGKPFQGGRRLQSVLYLQMVEAALQRQHSEAVVERFGYFFPSVRAHGLRIEWDKEKLRPGLDLVDGLCSAVAAGTFLATNKEQDCDYCDYRPICGDIKRVTARSKQLLEDASLVELQPLREVRRG